MLNGINIINTLTETKYTCGTGTLIMGIALVIMGLLFLFILPYIIQKFEDATMIILPIVIGVLLLVGGICNLSNYFARTSYKITKYQVTIDNTVSYNEFTNRYDILSHEGNIYIIQNKLDNEIKSK